MNSSCKHPQPTSQKLYFCSFLFISLPWWISWNVRREIVPFNNPKVFIELSIVSYDPFFHLTLLLYPISKKYFSIRLIVCTNTSVNVCRQCGVKKRPWTFRHHKNNFKLQQTPIDRSSREQRVREEERPWIRRRKKRVFGFLRQHEMVDCDPRLCQKRTKGSERLQTIPYDCETGFNMKFLPPWIAQVSFACQLLACPINLKNFFFKSLSKVSHWECT